MLIQRTIVMRNTLGRGQTVPYIQCSIYSMFLISNVPYVQCSIYPMFHIFNVSYIQCSIYPMFHIFNVSYIQCSIYPRKNYNADNMYTKFKLIMMMTELANRNVNAKTKGTIFIFEKI